MREAQRATCERILPWLVSDEPRARQRGVWTFCAANSAPGILQSCPMTCPWAAQQSPLLLPNRFGDRCARKLVRHLDACGPGTAADPEWKIGGPFDEVRRSSC